MDFWPTDDQLSLQAGVRTFLHGRFPLEAIRAREETRAVIDRERWRELGEMGVFSLRRDGLGMREAVLVYEELGRALVPGPLVATQLAAGLVDDAADGDTIVTRLDARNNDDLVEYATESDVALCFDGGEVSVVSTSTLELEPVDRPLDALTPVARCTSNHPIGEVLVRGDEFVALHRAGVVLTAALSLGVALAATDLARVYALEREQFGRSIGSFQAVKHLLAEMLTRAEVARAGVYAAACALDGAGDGHADRAASAAKVVASEAAVFCGKTGIQVHGGMGFTWEVDAQRYWKRAVVLDHSFGSSRFHSAALAGTHALSSSPDLERE